MLGQGTLEGACISAASIDYTVNKFFRTSYDELSYGSIRLQPLLFQDDIIRLSNTLESAQSGNDRLENVMECKLLDLNLEISGVIILGPKKGWAEILEQIRTKTLSLGNQPMKIFEVENILETI